MNTGQYDIAMASERRLLHAALNFRYFECSYNIGWADLSATSLAEGDSFFARSIDCTKNSCSLPVSPGAGTRPEVSGVLGRENLNEKTPSLLPATASTN